MKMNKIIIPAAMLAVGVALVGSVSSTLAWYQYSTKAQAAYIGTSAGVSENLQIQNKNGDWVSNLSSSDIADLMETGVGSELTPISPAIEGNLDATSALPNGGFYNSVETGVGGVETYGDRRANNKNYVEFTLKIRYLKTNYANPSDPYGYANKALKLVDLTILDGSTNADLYKAVRVHISSASGNYLFMKDSTTNETVETATYGKLDTDSRDGLDTGWAYEWESSPEIVYGKDGSIQTAYNSNYSAGLNKQIGELPASNENGLAVKVTIWLEGWQKLSGVPTGNAEASSGSSAMWDPTVYANKQFKVGMRFQADDIQQNP